MMKAAMRDRFGPPDAIQVRDVDIPGIDPGEVLVRVRAVSLNRAEWYSLTGTPYIGRPDMGMRRPKSPMLGVDFAGTVEAVAGDRDDFQVGDEVFGGASGTLAEYVVARKSVALKPENSSFAEAASLGTAAITALQGLRDHGQVQSGEAVLINGASGGVGTFAVQIAKAMGSDVTAVCSTRHVGLVSGLGADRVIDYTKSDFADTDHRYGLILDVAGGRKWSAYRRVLADEGRVILIGAPTGSRLLGPLSHIIQMRLGSAVSRRSAKFFVAKFKRPDLETLARMVGTGELKPVIDREFDLDQVADAFRYLGEGHAMGKIVVEMGSS
jgi:NADPH:quinone reductase-like Zn-dependent oxidoreductase